MAAVKLSITAVPAGLVVLLAMASPAGAVAPPDSARLAELRAACDSAWRVRVTTASAIFERRGMIMDAGGITIPQPPGRPAIFTVGDARRPERILRWSEIETVGSEQPRVLKGGFMGLFTGAALGVAMLTVLGPRAHDAYPVVVWSAGIVTLGFAAFGFVIGAGSPEVHPLYP